MNKEILKLAIPNILSNLTVPLLTSVDAAVAGRVGGTNYLGALAFSGSMFAMLYWTLGFLRMGTVGLTSQSIGEKDITESTSILYRGLAVALTFGLLFILLQKPIGEGLLVLAGVTDELKSYTLDYFNVRIWSAPAVLGTFVFVGWLLGRQDSITPMVIMIIANIVNIVLTLLFVYRFDWDFKGIALGSVYAEYISFILAIGYSIYLIFKKKLFTTFDLVFQWDKIKAFFKLNFDIWLRTVGLVTAFFLFNYYSNKIGPDYLAANEILAQYIIWAAFTIDGFASAGEALVGKYIGEKNMSMIFKVVKRTFLFGASISILYSLIYWLFNPYLTPLFTNKVHLIELANQYVIWLVLMPIIGFSCYIWDGIYIGLTNGKVLRNSMFLALLVFIATIYLTQDSLQNHGVWLAWLLFLVGRSVYQTIHWYKRERLNLL